MPGGSEADGLDAVRSASELSALSAGALRRAVELARATGRTWQELGDVLGVTRQRSSGSVIPWIRGQNSR